MRILDHLLAPTDFVAKALANFSTAGRGLIKNNRKTIEISFKNLNLNSFSSQAHQNIVGMSLQAASTNIAALKAAGTTVRVIKPGQVVSSLPVGVSYW